MARFDIAHKFLRLLDSEVLFFCVRSHYLVIYRKDPDPLQVARVLHGARDISAELEKG